MTTFQMAQMAYENPEKLFKGVHPDHKAPITVYWSEKSCRLVCVERTAFDPSSAQNAGYVWEPVKEPRTWRGEYVLSKFGGQIPSEVVPAGVAAVVTWEAKEVLP